MSLCVLYIIIFVTDYLRLLFGVLKMSYATKQLAENKLIILYLVDKMGIPLSQSEICQFMLDKELADYFTIQ